MTVIALQFSWSAVSAYCLHESGRTAQHFGHHQHTDLADNDTSTASAKPDLTKKTAAHTHCSVFSHGALLIGGMDKCIFHPLLASVAPLENIVRLSSSYIPPPERPQWLYAV